MAGLKYLKQINHRDILDLADSQDELFPAWGLEVAHFCRLPGR